MNTRTLMLALLLALPSLTMAAGVVTPSMEEALKISHESGRPIFVVAGQET